MAALRPDGVFLAPPLSDDSAVLQWLSERKLPRVLIASSVSAQGLNIPTPERAAGRMVADHLITLGHRRIGVIKPPPSHSAAACRVDGFRDGLAAAGFPCEESLFVEGGFHYASGIAAGEHLLGLTKPPTAIFATNVDMALGLLALARRGNVPQHLSVVGFGDTPASFTALPPLTTVRQPLAEMGAAVIDSLINGPSEPPTFRFELVQRDSSAPPSA